MLVNLFELEVEGIQHSDSRDYVKTYTLQTTNHGIGSDFKV